MLALLMNGKRLSFESPCKLSCIDVFISIKPRGDPSTEFCGRGLRFAPEFRAAIPRVAIAESLSGLITLRRDEASRGTSKLRRRILTTVFE
jgi:hypothetical protein